MKSLLVFSLLLFGASAEPQSFQEDNQPKFSLPFIISSKPQPPISIAIPPRPVLSILSPKPLSPFFTPRPVPSYPLIQSTAPHFTQCYTGPRQTGRCTIITTSVPDLGYGNFDNQIQSVVQSGVWLYYENTNYNNLKPGRVYYVLGTRIAMTFPFSYRNVISSVRPIIDYLDGYQDVLTLYDGIAFTGTQYSWPVDVPTFGQLMGKLSSLVIFGSTPWTIFSGESYSGSHMCVYPSVLPIMKPAFKGISVGMYANLTILGIPNDSIGSAKKGCWSKKAAKPPHMPSDGQKPNGAWGRIM